MFSKENITFEEVDNLPKDTRQDTINNELLRINKIALQWALQNKVITVEELKDEKFFTENKLLSDFIANAGLSALGIGGSAYALSAVTAPTFFGLVGGGLTTLTVGGAAIAALPLIVFGLGIYGKRYYDNQKEVKKLIEYFNKEKDKILKFYLSKINKMQDIPPTSNSHPKEKMIIPKNKETEILTKNKKTMPISKEPIKEKDIPIIKKIEKDVDYDKCVVKYDDKCTIKHKGLIWDKKDGLNYQTFEDSIDRVLKIISDDIFNWESIEIVFIGIRSNVIKLQKKAKVFEKNNSIDKAIIITFIDITKNAKS